MNDIKAPGNISIFGNLQENDLQILLKRSTIRQYKKNTIIVNKGDESDSLYVILDGNLNAYVDDDGKELILSKMGPGESFGELSLLSNHTRSASVISTTACKLAIISKPVFMDCLSRHPEIAYNIIQSLINRVHNLTENISNLALHNVYGRIVNVLKKNAFEKDGRLATAPLTHQDIANMIGSSREMVSKILKDLKTGGYIDTHGKSIIIERDLPSGW